MVVREEVVVSLRAEVKDFVNKMLLPLQQFKSLTQVMDMNQKQFTRSIRSNRISNQTLNDLGFNLERVKGHTKLRNLETGKFNSIGNTFNQIQEKMPKGLGKVALGLRNLTHGAKGFRMEMLGVMFFGLALQQMFTSLLQPAMEAAGIFDLLGATLEILFLPISLVILDILMPFLEFFMNLPDSVKLALGALVVAGLLFGFILFTVGSLALGIGSLILALGELVAIGPEILVVLGVAFSAIANGVFGMVFSTGQAKDMMKNDFGIVADEGTNIVDVLLSKFGEFAQGLPQPIKDALSAFSPVLDLIGALFSGDFQKISDVVGGIVSGMIDTVKTFILDGIKDVFGRLENMPEPIASIMKLFKGIWESIVGFLKEASQIKSIEEAFEFVIKDVFSKLENMPEPIASIMKLFKGIWGSIVGFLKEVSQIKSIEDAFEFVIKGISKWGEWGMFIAGEMIKGIKEGMLNKLGSVVSSSVSKAFPVGSPLSGLGLLDLLARSLTSFVDGGIVTSPTLAMVGERGPEAITPLGQGGFGGNVINITVNTNTASGVTGEEIASLVERRLGDELRRL